MPSTIHAVVDSPLGGLTLVSDGEHLTAVHQPTPDGRGPTKGLGRPSIDGVLADAAQQLKEYFAGERAAFDLPLAEADTDFKRDVFAAVGQIPYGEAATYGDIADTIGKPRSVVYVAAALNANRLTIVVPCHRVIGQKSSGYAADVANKEFLQRLEERHRAALRAVAPAKKRGLLGLIFR